MKNVEIVWRVLADAALEGQRDWNSIGDIADASSVAPSTTHQALGRLVDIGAVRPNSRRGYTVVSPEKLLEAFAAHRNLRADTMVSTTLTAAQELLDNEAVGYALSGSSAAVHYLGGRNTISDLGRRIVYSTRVLSQADFPEGDEVIILTEDQLAARTWTSGYASLAQTYADLWASPGWQAAEFTRALKAKLFAQADWQQRTHFSEKGQKDAREILALLKLDGVDPALAAEALDRASTVDTQELPVMIGEVFDLIGKIIKLSKADQKLIAAAKKSWVAELLRRGAQPQTERPRL